MKAKELANILKVSIKNNYNILVTGAPGSGKSDIMSQVCKELGYECLIVLACVRDPVDFVGLPSNVDGEAKFLPFAFIKKMLEAEKELVIFFDDLGWASIACQQACASIILSREIDGKKISDKVRFVACTNRKTDNAGVGNFIAPLISRFNTIINLDVDVDSWKEWALRHSITPEIISFLNFRPDKISTFTGTKALEAFACPRSIVALDKWIKCGITDLEVWQGCVGSQFSTEFMAFFKIYRNLGNLPEEAIKNPDTAPIPKENQIIYALVGALSNKSTEKNFDAVLKYISRLSHEFQVFFIKDVSSRDEKLNDTNAFMEWNIKNSHLIR